MLASVQGMFAVCKPTYRNNNSQTGTIFNQHDTLQLLLHFLSRLKMTLAGQIRHSPPTGSSEMTSPANVNSTIIRLSWHAIIQSGGVSQEVTKPFLFFLLPSRLWHLVSSHPSLCTTDTMCILAYFAGFERGQCLLRVAQKVVGLHVDVCMSTCPRARC